MEEQSTFRTGSGPWAYLIAGALWLLLVALCVSIIPPAILSPEHPAFFATLGLIAVWRLSWGGLHLARALFYSRSIFPWLRRQAEATSVPARHVGVVVMSWRMGEHVNAAVYGALLDDLRDYGAAATVVASISDAADERIIRRVLQKKKISNIQLITLIQDGSGKRNALLDALATLRDVHYASECPVLLMDGDTLVPPGTLRRTVPVLLSKIDAGALTLDNTPFTQGSTLAIEWYNLRMAQRHIYMCSLGLSERVLVLTGRWSLFRSQVALHPAFAAAISADRINHPRLGEIPMLTGEDKSTWRWVTERNWRILYVPDTVVHPLESLPGRGFVEDTIQLMVRWFGNMVRGGTRAIPLGPSKLGFFPWLALLDQRVSMWTTLVGPVFFSLVSLLYDPVFLAAYGLWVLFSRGLHSLLIGLASRRWHPVHIFLLYYNQLMGSLIKIYVFFHPDLQKWTRQLTGSGNQRRSTVSTILMVASFLTFVLVIAIIGGLFAASDRFHLEVIESLSGSPY